MKALIDLDFNITNETEIQISGSSTSFCYEKLAPYFNIEELLSSYDSVKKIAKEKGVIVGTKNRVKGQLKDLKPLYRTAYRQYYNDFQALSNFWKIKLKKGIYTGYTNDNEIQNLFLLRNKLDKHHHHESVLGKIKYIQNLIQEAHYDVNIYIKINL